MWPAEDTENTIHEVKVITRVDDCLINEVFGVGAWGKGRERPLHA